jgi:hypothetical protein
MKKSVFIFTALLITAACSVKQENKDSISASYSTYGGDISTEDAVSLIDLENNLDQSDSILLTVKATIEKTCPKKGCWMTVEDKNGNKIRVTFKDYGFFVPTEGAEGKEVVFTGLAKRKVTDVATLRHFAEDAGKSAEEIGAITEPKTEVEFVAEGVAIFEREEGARK